jgi:hypothetical protein
LKKIQNFKNPKELGSKKRNQKNQKKTDIEGLGIFLKQVKNKTTDIHVATYRVKEASPCCLSR